MSSQIPTPGNDEDGPSEEEVRQYLAQMRTAPADQVLAEVVQGLLNAAQVKLGRNDARLLLDACAGLVDAVRGRSGEELVKQVDQALSQLRLGQVEAEREVADAGQDEPNDVTDERPAGEQTGPASSPPPQQPSPQQPPQQGSGASKLWTPGS